MDNKMYRDEFENFLKDNANDFIMVPSRRVWHSIYNDMHPDRKWPSMAVCLLILTAVMYIGVSTNNSLSSAARRAYAENMLKTQNQPSDNQYSSADRHTTAVKQNTSSLHAIVPNLTVVGSDPFTPGETIMLSENNTDHSMHQTEYFSPASRVMIVSRTEGTPNENSENTLSKAQRIVNTEKSTAEDDLSLPKQSEVQKNKEGAADHTVKETDRSWKEDFAFRHKPRTNRFSQRAGLNYYITPSFGYRGFFKNHEEGTAARYATGGEKLNDGAALNLELGAALQYKLSSSLRIKAGLQGNYTNYVSKVTQLQHPTQVSLAVNRAPEWRASEYSVKSGLARLNKTTFQVSMPLGADLKIAGTNKIKWYIGGTIQPTYVISGSAYVLSDDAKNYISETPLLRKWNMNAAVETFVSFRPGTGITLNIGPQFRYQVLSTYKKEYNYTEKLYNIGLKIGVTTEF